MSWQDKINNLKLGLKADEPISDHSSMAVGGPATYFIEVKSVDELIECVSDCRNIAAPYKVIGYGTNIIASDFGFEGVLIKNKTSNINIDPGKGRLIADSGTSFSRMIMEAASAGLGGLEPLYGIPGSVGGAVINNAGSHGVAVSDFIKNVSIIFSSDQIENHSANWFDFSYRKSKLKYNKNEYPPVILSVIFQLQRRKKEDIMKELAEHKKWRADKQPLGIKSSGSIFRNPLGSDNVQNQDDRYKSAGFLLEQAGAKKFFVGGARVSKKHANWIENYSNASASDVRTLVDKMRNAVVDKFQVTLEEEVEYIGRWNGL